MAGGHADVPRFGAWQRAAYSGSADVSVSPDGSAASVKLGSGFSACSLSCVISLPDAPCVRLSAECETDAGVTDVFAVVSQLCKGDVLTREHFPVSTKTDGRILFSGYVNPHVWADSIGIAFYARGSGISAVFHLPTVELLDEPHKRNARIALGYTKYRTVKSYGENAMRLTEVTDRCGRAKPDIIVLGECVYDQSLAIMPETTDGVMYRAMSGKAKEYGCYLVYNYHESDGGRIYNTSVLFGRDGSEIGKYRKTHITIDEIESGITPGDEYSVFDLDFGKVGLLTCFDHYFPEPYAALAGMGAELICIPSAGDARETGPGMAAAHGLYLAICGMNGENESGWKAARVIAPGGSVIADGEDDGMPVICDIDLDAPVRRKWFSFPSTRSDVSTIMRFQKNTHIK